MLVLRYELLGAQTIPKQTAQKTVNRNEGRGDLVNKIGETVKVLIVRRSHRQRWIRFFIVMYLTKVYKHS